VTVPSPWIALILVAASYRIWRLLADDIILDRPRNWVVRLPRGWEEGDPIPASYRIELANFITCPWCFGFWITLAVWVIWQIEPHWTTILLVPFALSAAVGITRINLDPAE
jgi:hypothetical protein